MTVRGDRARPVVFVVMAAGGVVVNVVAAFLLASAVPYRDLVDVLAPSVVGAAYALAAGYVGLAAPARRQVGATMIVVAVTSPAAGLALGVSQLSGLWVALGAVSTLLVPAAAWLVLVTSRGGSAGRLGRAAVVASALLAGAVAGAVTLTYDPAAWGWCRCQPNPLALLDGEAAYVGLERWSPWLRASIGVLAISGALGELLRRPGRTRVAELALGVALVTVLVGHLVPQTLLLGAGLLLMLVLCVREIVRRLPSRAHVADLLLEAREHRDPARLEELVARAIGDPGARVWWWAPGPGAYRDSAGAQEADPTAGAPTSRVLRVDSEVEPIALVVAATRDLPADGSVLDAVAEALRLSTENRRLTDELRESIEQVRRSRARIVTATDEARKSLERDLHDGAQQLLISTGLKLNLAAAQTDAESRAELDATLAEASEDLGRALVELRRLASGITPTALVHGGLADAVQELAARCPAPVSVEVEGQGDPGPTRSMTAYFVVAECLTNVAKHAGAQSASVTMTLGEPLRLTVADDGVGGADPSRGSGLRGLIDRVEAHDGRATITSSDSGTVVTVSLPDVVLR
ncbi:sensor histidine kinase [Nocardioides euryhalodurans]|uniref:sensor histidine kinase n=1 Tax=Nocardioides euryhalodurans TaxID=2518370 RepID=UPI0014229F8C|nr:histidine kinase [Nocardioides euryhalodurans]